MALQRKHIGYVLGLLVFFSVHVFGQGQTFEEGHWSIVDAEVSMEQKILASIENMKRMESTIKDASIVEQLDSIGYLAIVQSGFNGNVSDENQRKGWWLLSYPVAVKYGLKINSTIDERMDLGKSTQVAFKYRQELVAKYGTEMADLVFVESPLAIHKFYSDSVNFPAQYEKMMETKTKVLETKNIFLANRENHPVGPAQEYMMVSSDQPISFEVLHQFLRLSTAELHRLNPKWNSGVYDPQYGGLRIPSSSADTFAGKQKEMEQKTRDDAILLAAANEKRVKALKGNIPDLNTYKPISYKVKMGDNLGRIAQRYHVRISDLRAWNGLRSDRIYAGQRMTIYVSKNRKYKPAPPVKKESKPKTLSPGDYIEYTVEQGDTLWAISQKYGHVSIENIMADNGIDENISPGQVLKIRKQ